MTAPHLVRLPVLPVLLALATGMPARAAPRPRVAVSVGSGEGVSFKVAQRLSAMVSEAVERGSDLDVVGTHTGRAWVSDGRRALRRRDFQAAVRDLRRGVTALMADPVSLEVKDAAEVYLDLAAALFRLGEEREAKEVLGDLLSLAPTARASARFPRSFRQELERASRRSRRRPRGQLSIEGPRGAEVFVDGRAAGRVPVLLEGLVVGTHVVQVEGSGGERFGQLVELDRGLAKVRASFSGPSDELDASMRARLAALCSTVDAAYAIAGWLRRGEAGHLALEIRLYAREQDATLALPPVALGPDLERAGEALSELARAVAARLVEGGVSEPERSSVATPVVEPRLAAEPRLTPAAPLAPAPPLAGLAETPVQTSPERVVPARSGPPIWLFVAGGVLAAAGLGAGVWLGASALRPVTGTVSATW